MKGDFSRVSFDATHHFCRVLEEMGQVRVDADHNEQVSILLHYLWTLGRDIIGPHGGPVQGSGFAIELPSPDKKGKYPAKTAQMGQGSRKGDRIQLSISKGHYYVDGILCENEEDLLFTEQPDFPQADPLNRTDLPLWVYLKVFEHYLSPLEDEHIRDVALGNAQTSSRSRIVWQVRVHRVDPFGNKEICSKGWQDLVAQWNKGPLGMLKARSISADEEQKSPCTIAPESRYRGANQLYRVEIHKSGVAGEATWKFSRENGSVIFPIEKIVSGEATVLTLGHLGQDSRFGLRVGDWVEIEDDISRLLHDEIPAVQVVDIDRDHMQVTVEGSSIPVAARFDPDQHPILRRWDHQGGDPYKGEGQLEDGALKIVEGNISSAWMHLENGIQIQFQPNSNGTPHYYRRGQYWLIPARISTGDILWPKSASDEPEAVPPQGMHCHFAPLGILSKGQGDEIQFEDWRHQIVPLGKEVENS